MKVEYYQTDIDCYFISGMILLQLKHYYGAAYGFWNTDAPPLNTVAIWKLKKRR